MLVIKKKKENMIVNYCRYSVILYLLPMLVLLLQGEKVHLQFAFLFLSFYGYRNHCRKYDSDIKYDYIDLIDRFAIIYICIYFIYYNYDSIIVCFSLYYMIFVYFIIIPKQKLQHKIYWHCSFHIVSLLSAILLLI